MKIFFILFICLFLVSCKNKKEETGLNTFIVDHINNEVEERFKPPFEAKVISYSIDKEIGNIRILLIDEHEYIHISKNGKVLFTHKNNCRRCQ